MYNAQYWLSSDKMCQQLNAYTRYEVRQKLLLKERLYFLVFILIKCCVKNPCGNTLPNQERKSTGKCPTQE